MRCTCVSWRLNHNPIVFEKSWHYHEVLTHWKGGNLSTIFKSEKRKTSPFSYFYFSLSTSHLQLNNPHYWLWHMVSFAPQFGQRHLSNNFNNIVPAVKQRLQEGRTFQVVLMIALNQLSAIVSNTWDGVMTDVLKNLKNWLYTKLLALVKALWHFYAFSLQPKLVYSLRSYMSVEILGTDT